MIKELCISISKQPILWCNIHATYYLLTNPGFHACTKHAEIDFHFVCDMVARKIIDVQFLSTKKQLVDIFIRPLFSARFSAQHDISESSR